MFPVSDTGASFILTILLDFWRGYIFITFYPLEQKKNVMLLVENLMEREEATFKMIIDCLYDLGSLNIINQKVSPRPLNRVMRLIARLSKPSFRAIAFYWVKKNTPELITDWLLKKVRF